MAGTLWNVCVEQHSRRDRTFARAMVNRRPVQQQHEWAVVRDFLQWLNPRRGTRFTVISEPNPPEAIIRSVRVTRWCEVGDVFWNDAYAQDLFSYATPDEVHKPIYPGPYSSMDARLAKRFIKVLRKKLEKRSYDKFRDELGPGYLLLPIFHPWFNGRTIRCMQEEWAAAEAVHDRGCFREVYITFQSSMGQRFRRWLL